MSSAIRGAFVKADGIINSGKCTGDDVLGVMQPFHGCTAVEGIPEHLQQQSICLIFALTADGYRAAGKPLAAAEWYRKASAHGSVHASLYMRMVCAHGLSDYYTDALVTAQRQEAEWKKRTWWNRLYVTALRWRRWLDPEWIGLQWHKSRDIKFLLVNASRDSSE